MKEKVFPVRSHLLGSCIRALAFSALGVIQEPPPKHVEKIFKEGHRQEIEAKDILKKEGYKLECQPESISRTIELSIPEDSKKMKFKIIGHLDGRIKLPFGKKKVPLEIKGFNSWNFTIYREAGNWNDWKDEKLKEKYAYQLGSYMILDDSSKIAFAVKNKKGNTVDLQILERGELPSQQDIEERLSLIIPYLRGYEKSPPLPLKRPSCSYCGFPKHCDAVTNSLISTLCSKPIEVKNKFIREVFDELESLKDKLEKIKKSQEEYIRLSKIAFGFFESRNLVLGKKNLLLDRKGEIQIE